MNASATWRIIVISKCEYKQELNYRLKSRHPDHSQSLVVRMSRAISLARYSQSLQLNAQLHVDPGSSVSDSIVIRTPSGIDRRNWMAIVACMSRCRTLFPNRNVSSDLIGLEWSGFDPQIHSIRRGGGGAPGLQYDSRSNIYYK